MSCCLPFAHAEGQVPAGKIKDILFYEGHTGVLIVHERMSDPDKCGRQDFFILRQVHPLFKEMYAALLSAHIAGQPLSMTLSGCHQGLPSVIHLRSAK